MMKFSRKALLLSTAFVAAVFTARLVVIHAQQLAEEKPKPTLTPAPEKTGAPSTVPAPPGVTPRAGEALPSISVVSDPAGGSRAVLSFPPATQPLPGGFVYAAAPDAPAYQPILPTLLSSDDRAFEAKSLELVARLKDQADQAQRKAVIADLTELVTNHFNSRQKQREQELKQLEEQLKKLRSIQERREAARDDIISDRVRQLIRESEGLNWGTTSTGPNAPRYAVEHVDAWTNRAGVVAGSPHPPVVARIPTGAGPMPKPDAPSADEIRFFSIEGVEGSTEASHLIPVLETLLGSKSNQVTLTSFGNKIICKGNPDDVKQVESLINQLQDNQPGRKSTGAEKR